MAVAVRIVSFVAALAMSLALLLFPFLLRHIPEARLHSALPVVLIGIAGAFIDGIGYRADNRLCKALFSPACAWIMILSGTFLLLTP